MILTNLNLVPSTSNDPATYRFVQRYHVGLSTIEGSRVEVETKSLLKRMLEDIEFHTPTKGYNLCSVDCFEDFGEQLYVMGHYDNYDEALAAKNKHENEYRGARCYIYPRRRALE